MKEQVRICRNHQDKEETPLIETFAFNGAEYWCPACGTTGGMMGAGELVPFTWWLHNRLIKYKKKSSRFLSARSSLICSELKYKGEWITPKELPERSRNYRKSVVKNWKYKFN